MCCMRNARFKVCLYSRCAVFVLVLHATINSVVAKQLLVLLINDPGYFSSLKFRQDSNKVFL